LMPLSATLGLLAVPDVPMALAAVICLHAGARLLDSVDASSAMKLALGLLISTRARSQFQAMQMTLFLFLPSILLSGFMFPFAGMPRPVQWLAEVLPLTHFLRLVRGI
ncbi:ABC transporter permease, partial [Pseudomonas aeruginosa]|uniref:ABC transporter permease n=1 Tax=Pseudomonas aeruginosa TaxID=287 RepID=UPI002119712C